MQDLLVNLLGDTGATVARYVIAIVVVVLLLVALRWALRRYMGGPGVGQRGRQPRLAVMDVAVVDARRRLVLVRRDGVEHLLLIGGPSDLVVEQTIIKGVPVGTMGSRMAQPTPATAPVGTAAATVGAAAALTPSEPPALTVVPPAMPDVSSQPPAAEPPARVEPFPRVQSAPKPVQSRAEPPVRVEPVAEPVPVAPNPAGGPALAPVGPAGPYVPPEPTRPVAQAEPIAPIVAVPDRPAAVSPSMPAPANREEGFDDLARRLDEALRVDLEAPPAEAPAPAGYTRPTRGPAARAADKTNRDETREPALAAPVAPEPELPAGTTAEAPPQPEKPAEPVTEGLATATPTVEPPAENVIELPAPKPAPGGTRFSSAWFRPRKAEEPARPAPTPAPEVSSFTALASAAPTPEPAAPVAEPAEPEIAAAAPPQSRSAEVRKSLADDLARILEDEPIEESPAPLKTEPVFDLPRGRSATPSEPAIEVDLPAPAAEAPAVEPEQPTRRPSAPATDTGLSSLEDEMARLLDELAGESKPDRR